MKITEGDKKFFDFLMTDGDWEKTERIQLYRKLGKLIENKDISPKQMKKIKEILNEK